MFYVLFQMYDYLIRKKTKSMLMDVSLITLLSQLITRLKIYLDCKSFCFYFSKPGIIRPNVLVNNNYVRTL